MAVPTSRIADHIDMIDHHLLEIDGFGSTYVVRGTEIALIETGTSVTAPTTLAGLRQLGIDPAEVRHILLTHIHMDHAGGAGELVRSMPHAHVYINSMTAEHLVDPARLLRSVERAVGDMWSMYGTMTPIEASRIRAAEDLHLDLGRGVVIESIATPGHAPDHLAFWEANTGTLWAGDAIGIVMSTYPILMPVTPPPTYDLAAQQATIDRLRQLPIERLLVTHFGPAPYSVAETLDRMQEDLTYFSEGVRRGLIDGEVPVAALLDHVVPTSATENAALERVVRGTALMSIGGMQRYFEKNAPHLISG